MTILIVDDSKAMRLIITRALREIGLGGGTFLEAPDGAQALNIIQEQHPDVVFCDLNMPGMTGMELLHALRAKGLTTLFGFVTSEASTELRQEAQACGALFVVTKPFTAANIQLALAPVFAGLGGTAVAPDSAPQVCERVNGTFPKVPQVSGLLKGLFSRPVSTNPALPTPMPPRNAHVLAEFEKMDDGAVIACAVCDVACAVNLGAAFTLIPVGAATDAIKAGLIESSIAENLGEVLNIMSRLFEGGHNHRIRLGTVHFPGDQLCAPLHARVAKPAIRTDMTIDVAGYGKGNMTLLSLK